MKNGVEYSKSRNYRIVKNHFGYHVEHAEYRISDAYWTTVHGTDTCYLDTARKLMRDLEEGVCPQ